MLAAFFGKDGEEALRLNVRAFGGLRTVKLSFETHRSGRILLHSMV